MWCLDLVLVAPKAAFMNSIWFELQSWKTLMAGSSGALGDKDEVCFAALKADGVPAWNANLAGLAGNDGGTSSTWDSKMISTSHQ